MTTYTFAKRQFQGTCQNCGQTGDVEEIIIIGFADGRESDPEILCSRCRGEVEAGCTETQEETEETDENN